MSGSISSPNDLVSADITDLHSCSTSTQFNHTDIHTVTSTQFNQTDTPAVHLPSSVRPTFIRSNIPSSIRPTLLRYIYPVQLDRHSCCTFTQFSQTDIHTVTSTQFSQTDTCAVHLLGSVFDHPEHVFRTFPSIPLQNDREILSWNTSRKIPSSPLQITVDYHGPVWFHSIDCGLYTSTSFLKLRKRKHKLYKQLVVSLCPITTSRC
jgi:hypothetical protein